MVPLKILAVESSCDDTAASIVENGKKIIVSKVASQIDIHKIYGGVVPEIASRNHIESIGALVSCAMEEAKLEFKDLDALAVTYAPGLVGSLLVGLNFVKGLSLSTGLPIVPVHHIKAHVASLYLSNKDLKPPFLCLVVSGGHSSILEVVSHTKLKTLGKTRDDAAGEAFDKIGRKLGLDYPGGVALDKLAETGNPYSFELPVPLKDELSTYDFSFSGLKTAMVNIIHNLEQKGGELPVHDLAATFRRSVTDCLVSTFMRAAKNKGYSSLGICGGVSANSLLRSRLEQECNKRGWKFFKPLKNLCGDNAAMVGAQAYFEFLENNFAKLNLNAKSSLNVESI